MPPPLLPPPPSAIRLENSHDLYHHLTILFLPPPPLPRHTQAFVVPSIGRPAHLAASTTTTSLDASRINAKQEKRKRNRENMRKFKKGGKKGTSKKKMMRKLQSGAARQVGGLFSSCIFCTTLGLRLRVVAKYSLLTNSRRFFRFFITTKHCFPKRLKMNSSPSAS